MKPANIWGITPDLYDNNEEQVKAYLRGDVRKAAVS